MDLSSMFQNLGPAGGAILTGMQAGDAANEQKSMQAYRQAQMEDILQKTAQQAELHPLELQSKKQGLEKSTQDLEKGALELEKGKFDLTVGKLEGAVKKVDAYTQLLNAAALQLQNIPVKAPGDPTRHNFLAKFATDNGIDLKDPSIQGLIQQTSAIPADKLPEAILGFSNKLALSKPNIVGKIAEIKQQGIEQRSLEGMRESARAKLQKEKLNTVATYEAELAKAKSPSQKASVALAWALKTADPEEQVIFKQHAKAFEDQSKQLNSQTIAAEAQKEAMDRLRNRTPITNQPRDLTKGTTKSGIGFTITPTSTD